MKQRMKQLLAVPLVALVATACSGNVDVDPGPQPEEGVVTVQVENNVAPPTVITAEAHQARSNVRTTLGSVAPMETDAFMYNPQGLRTGEFHLVATATDGTEYRSNPFTLVDAEVVEWDLATNTVTVTAMN